jgi:hypothetical protein
MAFRGGKKQGAFRRPVSTCEYDSPALPTYFEVELEVVAAASVFGFLLLLWCFFSVAGLVADASAAGAAVADLAGVAAAAGAAAGAAVVAAEANIGAAVNAATAAATMI